VLKQSLISLLRKPLVTIILSLIFILFCIVQFVALTLGWSAFRTKNETISKIGYQFVLASVDGKPINQETIANIEKIEHVIACNYYISLPATPEESVEIVREHEGETPETQEVINPAAYAIGDINFEAYYRNDMFADFIRGIASLTEGIFPTSENRGIIIEERFAKKNNFTLGDTMAISNNRRSLNIEIIGIYKTNATFIVTKDNNHGEKIYTSSPYNRIISDMDTARELFNIKDTYDLEIFVDSPNNFNYVERKIWEHASSENYQLTNMSDLVYEIVGKQVETVFVSSRNIILFISFITITVLFFLMSLYARSIIRETGILYILGMKKINIILFHMTQILTVGFVGTLLSILPGYIILSKVAPQLLDSVTYKEVGENFRTFITDSDIVLEPVINLSNSLEVVGILFILIFIVSILLSLYTSLFILNCKPREILLKD
jgi:ABC-type transport system, involved in lipoprotein release, permease component